MPQLQGVRYELADDADAAAIAELHAVSWRASYRGLFPDDYLDNEVFEDRAQVWKSRFEDRAGTLTIVARDDTQLVGFAHSVIDADPEWGTLLDNLHVQPGLKRSGVGKQLMAETAARVAELATLPNLHLWALEANEPARRFYVALGGVLTGTGSSPDADDDLPDVRYSWDRLDSLRELAARR